MDRDRATMARLLIQERDRALANAAEFSELPGFRSRQDGLASGLNMALAYLAGWDGYLGPWGRLRYEAAVLGKADPAPSGPGPDDPTDDDEPQAVPPTETTTMADVDAFLDDSRRQAELDTQREPWGGTWAPSAPDGF